MFISSFLNRNIFGVFSTFVQSIYRQIRDLGMQSEYLNDESVRTLCRKIMALALVPLQHVMNAYDEVRAATGQLDTDSIQKLLNYFDRTWMTNIDLWNVSLCDSRTINVCEGKDYR